MKTLTILVLLNSSFYIMINLLLQNLQLAVNIQCGRDLQILQLTNRTSIITWAHRIGTQSHSSPRGLLCFMDLGFWLIHKVKILHILSNGILMAKHLKITLLKQRIPIKTQKTNGRRSKSKILASNQLRSTRARKFTAALKLQMTIWEGPGMAVMGIKISIRSFQIRNMISTPSTQLITITILAQIGVKFPSFCILNVEKYIIWKS